MSDEHAVTLPLAIRLDDALFQLRYRLESRCYAAGHRQRQSLNWQTTHFSRMNRQVAMLEGLFRAWMPERILSNEVSAIGTTTERN
jgi:hypothetical protein